MLSAPILTNRAKIIRLALRRLESLRIQFLPKPHSTHRSISTSSTMPLPPSEHRAPWRDQLDSHFSQTPDYEFTVATVGFDPMGRPVPRVRTCGCRGFFPELDLHPNGQEAMEQQVDGNGNPHVYESDMLVFTTDVRMEKLGQLEASGHAIEGVFWLKDLMTQWRIKGRAFSIGDPRGEDAEEEKTSRQEIVKGLRVKESPDGDAGDWTWEKAVTKYFANHSPIMRGTFRSPPPGLPRSQKPSDPALSLGQKVTDLHDPVARCNFRVVVIQPEEVERLDLTNQEDVRRWKWTLVHANNEAGKPSSQWLETEVWP